MKALRLTPFYITPYLLSPHGGIVRESATSILARIAWQYRCKPVRLISDVVFEYKNGGTISLWKDVAAFCNSVTDKSVVVSNKLSQLTGMNISDLTPYPCLRDVIDRGAHGLICKHKKWCAQCYRESFGVDRCKGIARVADEIYWSLDIARYCEKHFCRLSSCCGSCYQTQPHISNKYEPGYCHYCGHSLADAPSVQSSDDEVSIQEAKAYLSGMDVFLPKFTFNRNITLDRLARNLRVLIDACGDDGVVVAECFGVSELTLKDWCVRKHGISLESLAKMVEGLRLPAMSLLFADVEDFLSHIDLNLSKQFNFHARDSRKSLLPEISAYLREMAAGYRGLQSRDAIALHFGVSTGMLEHCFRQELTLISKLYKESLKRRRDEGRILLQAQMDRAVRRCGAKMRPFDWPHIMVELKSFDVGSVTYKELDLARVEAIKKYTTSSRRDGTRDITGLLPDD